MVPSAISHSNTQPISSPHSPPITLIPHSRTPPSCTSVIIHHLPPPSSSCRDTSQHHNQPNYHSHSSPCTTRDHTLLRDPHTADLIFLITPHDHSTPLSTKPSNNATGSPLSVLSHNPCRFSPSCNTNPLPLHPHQTHHRTSSSSSQPTPPTSQPITFSLSSLSSLSLHHLCPCVPSPTHHHLQPPPPLRLLLPLINFVTHLHPLSHSCGFSSIATTPHTSLLLNFLPTT